MYTKWFDFLVAHGFLLQKNNKYVNKAESGGGWMGLRVKQGVGVIFSRNFSRQMATSWNPQVPAYNFH